MRTSLVMTLLVSLLVLGSPPVAATTGDAETGAGSHSLSGTFTPGAEGYVHRVWACSGPCQQGSVVAVATLDSEDAGRFELHDLPVGEILLRVDIQVTEATGRGGYVRLTGSGDWVLVDQPSSATPFVVDGPVHLGEHELDTDGRVITGILPRQPRQPYDDHISLDWDGGGRGATAKQNGSFEVRGVTTGSYRLKVSYFVDGFCEIGYLQRLDDGRWRIVDDREQATVIEVDDDLVDLGRIVIAPAPRLEFGSAVWRQGFGRKDDVSLPLQVRHPEGDTAVEVRVGSCRTGKLLATKRRTFREAGTLPVRARVRKLPRRFWVQAFATTASGVFESPRVVHDKRRQGFVRSC